MLHSFPNIRIGLMVGIGGGAPSQKHDIRLGDIVVTAPRDGKSGVFQYDYGKTIQDENFRVTGFLNQPSAALRAAVNGLKTQYEDEGHQLEDAINNILKTKPRLRMRYKRPDQGSDRLYRSTLYPPYKDNPVTHYGLIASANQLMKDARTRDKLAAEMDVLCFEMEAAGLINHFPCLQGYAAIITAAYVKDLPNRIPPNKVEAEKKIRDILSEDRKEDLKILNWIIPTDYSPQQSGYLSRRQPGTGIPRVGKTILMSIVVNHLLTEFQAKLNVGVAYIYFTNLLLATSSYVRELYDNHINRRTRLLVDELAKVLHSVITIQSRVYVILNLLATSRPIQDIQAKFQGSLSLKIRATNKDLQAYLIDHMTRLPSFVQDDAVLQTKIKDKIVQATDGMLLLAPLHVDALAQEPTVGHIELALQKLPRGVDEIYERAMARIQGQGGGFRELALKVLSFVIHAKRTVSSAELRHAVAVKIGQPMLDEKFIPRLDIINSICGGLITIDNQSDIVRLVHYTTQEYFDNTKQSWFPGAEAYITVICTTYLSFSTFEGGSCRADDELEERLLLNPLYDYAAHNWGHHAREVSQLPQEVMKLIACQAKVDAATQALMVKSWHYSQRIETVPRQITSLHLAAFFGVQMVVERLVQDLRNLNPRDSNGRTPLSYAAQRGHEAVVKLLVEKDVDAEAEDEDGRAALSYAAGRGHEAVVKLLLEKGVNAEAKDKCGRTVLSYAAQGGYEVVVRLLLEKGVDVEVKDQRGQTALSYAAGYGHEAVVRLLLEKGVNRESLKEGVR
ncbi:hypothetical protein B0H67DRAFT_672739 [Lasiosphaeris hirsuta]|uniref:GPI inositol-deacylase winged helix domain-containing protein n=1 Tax=Lasiosphaeris hirsuta TaxID=260670 RepID=A0AA40DPL7_9PEZI|nr:hypothetical protein B0H67DRAFT_672739 [Lasiosphaeris hirsuta]